MQRFNIFKWLMILAAIVIGYSASAQSTINTYSNYTMYGFGELQTQGTLPTRSMGGAGVAMRSGANINLLNPASYCEAIPKGILIDFGLDASCFMNSQKQSDGSTATSTYSTANFHDIALQIPLYKGLGMGFSVTPYSQVGYSILGSASVQESVNLGYVSYIYGGEGNITDVKLGLGYKLAKNFSVGAAAVYYWGQIDRAFSMSITPITSSGSYSTASGVSSYEFSKIMWQLGAQWSPIVNKEHVLTFGATYDFGGDLNPRYTNTVSGTNSYVEIVAVEETSYEEFRLPHQFTIGAFYRTDKMGIALDYTYQNWSSNTIVDKTITDFEVAYTNSSMVKAGVEYTPNRTDIRSLAKRITYRAGARYGNYYQTVGGETLPQYAATFGVGVPINMVGITKLDFGLEFGGVGNLGSVTVGDQSMNLVRQNYIKVAFGLTLFGNDYWFQRPKYD